MKEHNDLETRRGRKQSVWLGVMTLECKVCRYSAVIAPHMDISDTSNLHLKETSLFTLWGTCNRASCCRSSFNVVPTFTTGHQRTAYTSVSLLPGHKKTKSKYDPSCRILRARLIGQSLTPISRLTAHKCGPTGLYFACATQTLRILASPDESAHITCATGRLGPVYVVLCQTELTSQLALFM